MAVNIIDHTNIWHAEKGTIVIPVNCVGVMGAGLAKQCAERFGWIYKDYHVICRRGEWSLMTVKYYPLEGERGILLLPTKVDWKDPSELEWVASAIEKLGNIVRTGKIHMPLHVPMLGCGCGDLDDTDVLPMLMAGLDIPDAKVTIYG